MKKGEIAISVIIVIALGLIVLITLSVLLVSSTTDAREVTDACQDTYGGTCTTRSGCLNNGGRVVGGVSCASTFSTEYDNDWAVQSYPLGGGVCCVE